MGWQLTLMIVEPENVTVPLAAMHDPSFNFLFKKLITISYYLVVFAPIALGIPRYDFYGGIVAMLYTWMITISKYVRDASCAMNHWPWVFNLMEHISWTLLSIFIPALLLRVALHPNLPGTKKNWIGRFNQRFRAYIDGYENWKEEQYYFHTRSVCTSKHLRNTEQTFLNKICFNPRNRQIF